MTKIWKITIVELLGCFDALRGSQADFHAEIFVDMSGLRGKARVLGLSLV